MKKINVEEFRPAKAELIENLKRRNPEKWELFNNELSLYCSCAGFPVFAAIIFAQEEFPQFYKELETKKAVIKEFYGYE